MVSCRPRFLFLWAWCFWLTGLSLPGTVLGGEEPAITRISLEEEGGMVLATAVLDARMEQDSLQALEGGIPFTFRYRFRLSRRGGFWGEKVIREEVVVHTLQFDPLKKIYRFTAQGYPQETARETPERSEALGWLTTVFRWPLYPVGSLSAGIRYRLRTMATLHSAELPSVLGYLFFFTSVFNRETAWKEMEFGYR